MAATYAVRADVINAAGGLTRLIQLSDYDGEGVEDAGLVDDALCEAEALVNSYVHKVYSTPIDPAPEVLKRMTANITIWVLKSRRDSLTDNDELLQDQRIKWLENLAAGKVDLGIPAPASSGQNVPSTTERPSSKAVSRNTMKGFV